MLRRKNRERDDKTKEGIGKEGRKKERMREDKRK